MASPRDAVFAVPDPREAADLFAPIASLLWTERELLENLLFRLVEQRLILAAGQHRWFVTADAEVRAGVERVQEHEILRAAETEVLLHRFGLPDDASLDTLLRLAPAPWPDLLREHGDALRELTLEIDDAAAENRRLVYAAADGLPSAADHSESGRSASDRSASDRSASDHSVSGHRGGDRAVRGVTDDDVPAGRS